MQERSDGFILVVWVLWMAAMALVLGFLMRYVEIQSSWII